MADQRQQLSVSQVLADLADGKSREEIKEKYNLNSNDMKKLFDHPKLKGRRTKKAPSFQLVDDTVQEEQPKKSTPKKKVTAEVATSGGAVVSEVVATEEVKEEEETTTNQVVNEAPSSGIAEVSSPDDNVELAEEKPATTDTKKGLW